jgi:hypothetical protein
VRAKDKGKRKKGGKIEVKLRRQEWIKKKEILGFSQSNSSRTGTSRGLPL